MSSYTAEPTRAMSGAGAAAPRTQDATDRPPPPVPGKLGFHFDAVPQAVYDDFRAGWLKPIDLAVVVEMVRWGAKRGRRDSCWTTRKVIARAIDRDPRTVQSSWHRLAERGWIERDTFEGEDRFDADDPDNHTGSRIYFNWAPGRTRPGRDPAEAPPPRRKRGRPRKGADAGGEKIVSPPREVDFGGPAPAAPEAPPETLISPPRGKLASPKELDEIPKGDRETFNVTALAREGDRELPAAVDPTASGEVAPAAAPGAPDPGPDDIRGRQAQLIVQRFKSEGYRVSPDGVLDVPPALRGKVEPPPERYHAALAAFLPEVMAILHPGPDASEVADGPAGGKPAPAVPKAVKADVLARIGRLPGHPDRAEVAATGRALAAALGPHRDEGLTVATFVRLAGDVRGGGLAVGWLIEAFEEACGRSMEARGAVLIAALKRRRSEEHRRAAAGRGSPPPAECRP